MRGTVMKPVARVRELRRRLRPPRLAPGARVMLVAPAGPVSEETIETAMLRCATLGFEPVLAPSVRERRGYLAGPDALRAADLQGAFDDARTDAIWAIRGGYGALRLLPCLDLTPLRSVPKAFIGLSDSTALHLALAGAGLVSFHGPNAGAAAFPEATEACFRRVLCSTEPPGYLPYPDVSVPTTTLAGGSAEGRLAGGNLALVAAACGTAFQLQGRGAIVLLEDVGEPVYRIDRMLTQLALSGALDGAAAIAFGHFTQPRSGQDDRLLLDTLREWIAPLGIPAALGLPFGHVLYNWTLPLGALARLDADGGTLEVLEPAVA